MRVLRLQADNILRLTAIDITPQGNLVIVGGANGAGKSSVINSIAMALGGKELCPEEPIHGEATEGKVSLDLGDFVVTRKFTRERFDCNCTSPAQAEIQGFKIEHEAECNWHKFGDTRSTLSVKNKDGASYPSPQAMLDKLLGELTFDPLEFARARTPDDRRQQAATLRALVGVDTTILERQRDVAAAERALAKRSYETKAAQLLALKRFDDAPAAEIPMEAISQEMLKAEEYRKLAEDAERAVEKAVDARRAQAARILDSNQRIAAFEEQIKNLRQEQMQYDVLLAAAERDVDAKQITAQSARAVVPDPTAIRQRLTEAEATNQKVRATAVHDAARVEVQFLLEMVQSHDAAVRDADESKRLILANATFPIEGLGLTEDGVTFNGLPFSQASTAEQLRVSVAIGIALNPRIKVLIIRSGNLLDDDSMAAVAEQADAAGMQIWVEWVTKNSEGVQVFIEDGHVA